MHLKKRIMPLLLALILVFSAAPIQALAADKPVTVTVFTTNDIHGTVNNSETSIGLAQAAAIKASTPNALLVDAGDATQGASFATVSQGEDVIKVMNAAGYDAMAAGNHEFDYGSDRLLSNKKAADFPILGANVTLNGKPMLDGHTVVEAGGKSIAFIGLTTVSTASSTNPSKLAGVEFLNEIKAAKEQIAEISDTADAIVLITHMGDNSAAVENTSADLLNALTDSELSRVAAVVDGHSHTVEQKNYTRGAHSVPVIQTGTNFTALGQITLTFDGDNVTAQGLLLNYEDAMNYPLTQAGKEAAENVRGALDKANAAQADILGQELCVNTTPLWGGYIYWDYAESRIVETTYGDFVTDAFLNYADIFAEQNGYDIPVVALENGGGISSALPAGKVTKGDLLNAFNHGNMVDVVKINPSQLYMALESGLTSTGQDETGLIVRERVSGSFMQVSGLTYTYDPAAKSGAKVTKVVLDNGTALNRADETTELMLVTNSYVSSSFIALGAEKLGELGGEDQIVMDDILSLTADGSPLNYPNIKNRILIANDKSPEYYTVSVPIISDKEDGGALSNVCVDLSIDGKDYSEYITDSDGNISVKLSKGAHTLFLKQSSDGQPVYVNNYSGSGTVTTKEGYYRLGFIVDENNVREPGVSTQEIISAVTQKVAEAENAILERTDLSDKDKQRYIEELKALSDETLSKLENVETQEEADALYSEFLNSLDNFMAGIEPTEQALPDKTPSDENGQSKNPAVSEDASPETGVDGAELYTAMTMSAFVSALLLAGFGVLTRKRRTREY